MDQLERFIKRQPGASVPAEHRIKIESEGDAIVPEYDGQESQRITAKDLEKLPETSLRHIQVEESGSERILWHCLVNGQQRVFDADPYTSVWQRFGVGLMCLFPIESQL